MESQHISKPKIAKQSASKLPDAFVCSSRPSFNPQRKEKDKEIRQLPDPRLIDKLADQNHRENQTERGEKKKRKTQNPIRPVRDCFKMMEKFETDMKCLQQKLLEGVPQIPSKKIKPEDCVTLAIIQKSAQGCLKKILCAPTLKMHYVREFQISKLDKMGLEDKIGELNARLTASGLKIVDYFWNFPEGSVSLLYEYIEGISLLSLLKSIGTLPYSSIRAIYTHYIEDAQTVDCNCELVFTPNGDLRYLPILEESPLSSPIIKTLVDVYEDQAEASNSQKRIFELGVLMMICIFGEMIVEEDDLKLRGQKSKCCLYHDFKNCKGSLIGFSALSDPKITQILCLLLRYQPKQRMNPRTPLQFVKIQEYPELGQILSSMEQPREGSLPRLDKILSAIKQILQAGLGIKRQVQDFQLQMANLSKELGIPISKLQKELEFIYESH